MSQERLDFVPSSAPSDERSSTSSRAASGPPGSLDRRHLTWWETLRAHRRTWMALRGVREIILVAATYTLYDLTRYLVAGERGPAFRHGHSILNFEQRIHLDPEHALNRIFSAHIALGLPADYIYATLHYIVTPVVLIWLWRRHPLSYDSARTVLIATTIVGLVGFSLIPVAPPRLLGGFVDTMSHFSSYGWWSNAGSAPRGFGADTNQYAAMPSLHVGWALWSGWQLVRFGAHRVTRILGALYPVLLAFVVIGTGNHYLLDVVAGVGVVGIGAIFAKAFTTVTHHFWPPYDPFADPPAASA